MTSGLEWTQFSGLYSLSLNPRSPAGGAWGTDKLLPFRPVLGQPSQLVPRFSSCFHLVLDGPLPSAEWSAPVPLLHCSMIHFLSLLFLTSFTIFLNSILNYQQNCSITLFLVTYCCTDKSIIDQIKFNCFQLEILRSQLPRCRTCYL